MNVSSLNEAETRAELIDPALRSAGWGVEDGSRVRREVIAPGRLIGGGRRGKQDIADYVLIHRGQKLAVIEAKKRSLPETEGLGQAKRYAERLQARFAYSTNGDGIYRADMHTGEEGPVSEFPAPDELWTETFEAPSPWRERFGAIPFEDKGGYWQARYYQHNAINNALEAIADGRDRILLTLATGTGKTAIAFQIAWKLFHARWSLAARQTTADIGGEPGRRPRILFLADRNILANQAFQRFLGVRRRRAGAHRPGDDSQAGPRAEERQPVLHDLSDVHGFDRLSHQAVDKRSHQAVDKRSHQAVDRLSHQAVDKRSHQAIDKRSHQAVDKRSHQAFY